MKTHIYLAARYSRIEELRSARAQLHSIGYSVTSRWLNGHHQIDDAGLSIEAKREDRVRFATEDFTDLLAADWMISFTETPRSAPSRGGRHVEYGVALALSKRLLVVGPAENVFHCLPEVEQFDVWSECLAALSTGATV